MSLSREKSAARGGYWTLASARSTETGNYAGGLVRELDNFCRNLQQKGFHITQLPRMMPWGWWRHAYRNDADGHEISLYWAGENGDEGVQKAARA